MENVNNEEQESLLNVYYKKYGVSAESQSKLNQMTTAELKLTILVTAKDFLRAKQVIRLAKFLMLAMLGLQIGVFVAIGLL